MSCRFCVRCAAATPHSSSSSAALRPPAAAAPFPPTRWLSQLLPSGPNAPPVAACCRAAPVFACCRDCVVLYAAEPRLCAFTACCACCACATPGQTKHRCVSSGQRHRKTAQGPQAAAGEGAHRGGASGGHEGPGGLGAEPGEGGNRRLLLLRLGRGDGAVLRLRRLLARALGAPLLLRRGDAGALCVCVWGASVAGENRADRPRRGVARGPRSEERTSPGDGGIGGHLGRHLRGGRLADACALRRLLLLRHGLPAHHLLLRRRLLREPLGAELARLLLRQAPALPGGRQRPHRPLPLPRTRPRRRLLLLALLRVLRAPRLPLERPRLGEELQEAVWGRRGCSRFARMAGRDKRVLRDA